MNLNLRSGAGADLTKVRYLDLSGFDKVKCKSKYFTIRLQGSGGNLNLFNYLESTPSVTSSKLVLHVDNAANPSVYLVYTYGASEGTDINVAGDAYQKLTYSAGVYTVEFLQPIVNSSDVTGTTFESNSTYT